jgi:ribonuclease-3
LNNAAVWLKNALDYEFSDEQLLQKALTHRSAPGANNERLEYLGDAVLDTVISEIVFLARPDASEGALSRLRSYFVKDTMLADLASSLGIGNHIVLGSGEKKAGGHRRASILADAIEAVFGAVYLDSGFETAKEVIRRAYGTRLDDLPDSADMRDPKTRLQEMLQARKLSLPDYDVVQVSGKAHEQSFKVSCIVRELGLATDGKGGSRRDAEQAAAVSMIELMEQDA